LIEELPATALRLWLDDRTRAAPLVLDVREPWEHQICRIEDARLLPMQEIPARWHELPRDRAIVVMCHHGMRSLQVGNYLLRAGLSNIYNLMGGIAAWADQVEPAMPRY
jgi:rhodanese-related sulfurtransferase